VTTTPTARPTWRARLSAEIAPYRGQILAVAVVGVVATVWFVGPTWALPAYVFLAVVGAALGVIDARTHRLPNVIVLPAYPVSAALLAVASWGMHDGAALVRAFVGGAALYGAYFLLALVRRSGLGFGDVKLAGLLGAYLAWWGWPSLVVGAYGGFLLGGLTAIALLVTRRAGRKTQIPFGPFMLLGAALGIALGGEVWAAY
jgi:leader peptidase (prepilin peptidase)/N-methyltransferase